MQRQLADGNVTQDELLADYREIKTAPRRWPTRPCPTWPTWRVDQVGPDRQMEKKFAKNNDDFRKKFMSGSIDDQQEARFKKSMEQFELWFGNFSRDRKRQLRKASDARPLDNDIWLRNACCARRKS
jgi:hypothetical protein